MKGFGKSFLMAFSGYSVCPNSKIEKTKDNGSYVLFFLPIIGVIITVVINRWAVLYPYVCDWALLPAVFATVIPIILSGGSHLKGFFKTVDALSAHEGREERLKILGTDAHVGYSAVTVSICLVLISIGVWSEMPIDGIFVVAFAYTISRALAAISLLTMKHAQENKGSAYVPDNNASKWIQVIWNLGLILVSAYLMLEIANSFNKPAIAVACYIGTLLSYLYYVLVSKKVFGGVSEEVANYFIVICEVVMPFAALFAFKSPI